MSSMNTSNLRVALPLTFRALAIEKPGLPVTEITKTVSALADDEALIRVGYASINKMDPLLALRNGFQLPEPYVLGFDFSGQVVALGSPGGLELGEVVFGNTITGGGFAEYIVVKKNTVVPCGPLPAVEAAAYGIAYLTAYESMVLAGQIEQHAGKWIYIAGAAGGVGHFATQLAKLYGLKVIGTAGKAPSLALLKTLGVDHLLDYSKQNVVDEILALTQGRGVDLVYDSTYNAASYQQSAKVVASDGTYIRLGPQAHMANFGLPDLAGEVEARGAKFVVGDPGRYRTDPEFIPHADQLLRGPAQAKSWYQEKKLAPIVTHTVKFTAPALQHAFEEFRAGTINVGKVVVQVRSL